MWRDLAPSAWPEAGRLLAHPLVSALLGHSQGFDPTPPIADDDEPIDKKMIQRPPSTSSMQIARKHLRWRKRGLGETL